MADPRTGNIERATAEAEHIGPDYTGDNITAKKVANYVWGGTEWERQSPDISGLSVIDTNNSTSTPLAGGATFTGTATDVTDYNSVYVQAYSDVASATVGIKIQSSTDGTNWDHDHEYTVSAGSARHINEALIAKYFRVVYINGVSAQATFRLQSKLLKTPSGPHTHPIEYTLTGDHEATIGRSILTAQKPNTDYVNINATASGNLKMSVQEISDGLDIGAGNAGTETQRVSISTDDVNLSAIKTAQTNGTQKIQIVDAGGDAVTVTGGKLDVNSSAPVGGATETKQDSQIVLETTLNSLIDTLQELIQRLSPLAGAMNNTAQLRVVQSSVPSTAVTGPITSAQSIAEKTVAGIMYPEQVANINSTAIQSNINNAIAA